MRLTKGAAQLAAAGGLAALLLSTPAVAAPQDYNRNTVYRADRISTQGRVAMITQEGDRYRIRLDHGAYDYYIPASEMGSRSIRVGDPVRLSGLVAGDLVNVDLIATPGESYYVNDPRYVAIPYGTNGWMTATVQNSNRHLGYLTVREDTSGQIFKVDVRHMDRSHPVKVWSIRPGDRISINGTWENRDTFDASRIEY
jgi:hypothetical protein